MDGQGNQFPGLPKPTVLEVRQMRRTLPPHLKELSDDQLRVILMTKKQREFSKIQAQQAIKEKQQLEQQLQLPQKIEQQQRNALQQDKSPTQAHQRLSDIANLKPGMQLDNAVGSFRGTSWHD